MDKPRQGPATGMAPYITVKGGRAAEAISFYEKAFGATEQMRKEAQDGRRLMHAHIEINGSALLMSDDFPDWNNGRESADPGGFTLHLQVDDADAWWTRAVGAGASVVMPLEDQFWGDRYGKLKDPFGFSWSIGGPVKS